MYTLDTNASRKTALDLRNLLRAKGTIDKDTENILQRIEHGKEVEASPEWILTVNIATFLLGIVFLAITIFT
ncbi:hypothetical protein ACFLZR_00805 [Candidatus Neomarinimicrobiota bacterium]